MRYLKESHRGTYINLLTSGRLNTYLAEIDKQAQERFERLIEDMKQAQGITEQLKAENALGWIQRLNNMRACAREIVERNYICTGVTPKVSKSEGGVKYRTLLFLSLKSVGI